MHSLLHLLAFGYKTSAIQVGGGGDRLSLMFHMDNISADLFNNTVIAEIMV